eukprot:XP_011531517.1 uncharacterized protein LOC105374378 isoform X1 [Homo sapiens]
MRGSKSLVCKRAGPPDGHIRRNDPQRGSPTGWEIRPAGRSATQPRQGQTDDKTETQKMNQLGSVHRASVWKSQNPDPDPNCSVPALTPNQPVPLSLVLFHPAFLSKNLIGRCGDGATTEEKVVKRASCLSTLFFFPPFSPSHDGAFCAKSQLSLCRATWRGMKSLDPLARSPEHKLSVAYQVEAQEGRASGTVISHHPTCSGRQLWSDRRFG